MEVEDSSSLAIQLELAALGPEVGSIEVFGIVVVGSIQVVEADSITESTRASSSAAKES